jgi:uncharacterized protein YutE (UPF0331/DUF86 family)
MSSERAALLETSIKKRLIDVQRHLTALEHAAAEFGSDFDLGSFEVAWQSDDPETLKGAYAVQAGYENAINGCIKIAQELNEIEGWSDAGTEATSIEALKHLQENGVITGKTRSALKDAQERRSDVQHDDVNVAAREIHAAAQAVLEHAPLLLQEVAGVLRQRR